jgi:hypothetical protein
MLLYLSTNEPTAYVYAGLDLGSDRLNYCSEIRIASQLGAHGPEKYVQVMKKKDMPTAEDLFRVSDSRDEVRNTFGYTGACRVARAENGSPKMEA